MSKTKCIDISKWNGNVNFSAIKKAGINCVIIQCGYGMVKNQKDPYFEKNYKNAKKAGLKVGVYHYSYAKSLAEIRKEAKMCLSWIKGKSFELPIYIDMEENSLASLGKSTLTKMAKEYCRLIKKSGYTAGVYANANWFRNYLNYNEIKKDYSIWLAQYASNKDFECDIWQYTDCLKISGKNFDGNYIYKSFGNNVKFKRKANLYPRAYKDIVGGTSKPGITKSKGTKVEHLYDDGTGWSKIQLNQSVWWVVNTLLAKKNLSGYKKITLPKGKKIKKVVKGNLSKSITLSRKLKFYVICTITEGKYKGYKILKRFGKEYYYK